MWFGFSSERPQTFKFLILSAEDKRITCYITCYVSSFHSLLGKDEMRMPMHRVDSKAWSKIGFSKSIVISFSFLNLAPKLSTRWLKSQTANLAVHQIISEPTII